MMAVRRVFRFDVLGIEELMQTIDDIPKTIQDQALRAALKKGLEPVAELGRSLAPRDDGDYADSIAVSRRLNRYDRERLAKGVVAMYVGGTGRKGRAGHLIEFGTGPRYHKSGKYTGIMRPKPHLRPAWDALGKQAIAIAHAGMWEAFRDAVRRLRKRAERGKLSASLTRALSR